MEFVMMDIVYFMILFNCYLYVGSEYQVDRSIHHRRYGIPNSCILATPSLSANNETFTANLSKDLLKDGETAWVGYVMDYQMFQYLGCARVADIRNSTFITYTESNASAGPGYCAGACIESSMFGIQLNRSSCYCFYTEMGNVSIKRWDCDNPCVNNSDFACGGDNELSIYKQVQVQITIKESKDYTKNCLLYDLAKRKHVWEECTEKKGVSCVSENGSLDELYDKEWRRAADACFQPLRLEQLAYVNNESVIPKKTSWTALMRTLAIHKKPVTAQPNMPASERRHFCYVVNNGGIYTVKFTQNDSFTSNAICAKEVTSSVTMTTSNSGTTDTTATSDPETSTQSEIPDLNGPEKSTQNTGAYVGISIGALLVIVLCVALCIILKRRQDAKSTNNKKHPVHNHASSDHKQSAQFESNLNSTHNVTNKDESNRNELRNHPSDNGMALAFVYDNAYHLPETERGFVSIDSGNSGKISYINVPNKDTTALDSQLYSSTYSTVNKKGKATNVDSNERFGTIPSVDYTYAYDVSGDDSARTYDRAGHGTTHDNTSDTYDHIGQKARLPPDSRLYDKLPAQGADQTYDSTSSVPVKHYKGDNIYSHTHADNMDYSSCNVNSKMRTGTNLYQY